MQTETKLKLAILRSREALKRRGNGMKLFCEENGRWMAAAAIRKSDLRLLVEAAEKGAKRK
jgi:hypothetical protein